MLFPTKNSNSASVGVVEIENIAKLHNSQASTKFPEDCFEKFYKVLHHCHKRKLK